MPKAEDLAVLVVDDHRSMRQLTRFFLDEFGIRKITEAENGDDALSTMKLARFDLIISDWDMQGMDGLAMLKHLRSDPQTEKIPFIMATGQNVEKEVREAIGAGANSYIVKPFSAKALKQKIEAVIGQLE